MTVVKIPQYYWYDHVTVGKTNDDKNQNFIFSFIHVKRYISIIFGNVNVLIILTRSLSKLKIY